MAAPFKFSGLVMKRIKSYEVILLKYEIYIFYINPSEFDPPQPCPGAEDSSENAAKTFRRHPFPCQLVSTTPQHKDLSTSLLINIYSVHLFSPLCHCDQLWWSIVMINCDLKAGRSAPASPSCPLKQTAGCLPNSTAAMSVFSTWALRDIGNRTASLLLIERAVDSRTIGTSSKHTKTFSSGLFQSQWPAGARIYIT